MQTITGFCQAPAKLPFARFAGFMLNWQVGGQCRKVEKVFHASIMKKVKLSTVAHIIFAECVDI